MADEDKGKDVSGIVSEVTTKALQEMDIDEMAVKSPTGSQKGSRPGSAGKGSRPTSAASKASKPSSRPTSAVGGSKPPSRGGSRTPSVTGGSKPPSRPTSAVKVSSKPPSRTGSAASRKSGSKAGSVNGSIHGSRRGSKASQEGGDAEDAPAEDAPADDAPGDDAPGDDAPGDDAPGDDAPGDDAPGDDAPGDDAPAEDAPADDAAGEDAPPTDEAGQLLPPDPSSHELQMASGIQSEGFSGNQLADFSEEVIKNAQPMEEQAEQEGGWARPPGDQSPHGEQDPSGPMEDMQMTAPGGGDPGDSDDDDMDGEGDEEEEDMSEGDEDDDEESQNLVIMDPDHPKMRAFQMHFKRQLTREFERATLRNRELKALFKKESEQREDLGVDLYGMQQELSRYQMMLEQCHDELSSTNQQRIQMDQQLSDVRQEYKSKQLGVNEEKKKCAEMQGEVENLNLRIFYMQNAKEDVRSDIAVMKRAAEKADTEVNKMEGMKNKQDLYVDRLVERADKLREEIAMFDAQISAQKEETKEAQDALWDARNEIDAINMEKKQLFQQWDSTLIGMRRRDEAHSAMQEALRQQQQKIRSLETEIDGYKKSISKEQEENEKHTNVERQLDNDINNVRKLLTACLTKHDALKAEHATYSRMLLETEGALAKARADQSMRESNVAGRRKEIEAESGKKVKLQEAIIEKLRGQLTVDKATQYTEKIKGTIKKRTGDLEDQVAHVENEIAKAVLEISITKSRTERLKQTRDKVDDEIAGRNAIITKSESEIIRRNARIERKQGAIDQHNKKLTVMIQSAGGVELGPLEIEINSLHKSIDGQETGIHEMQRLWLHHQEELVELCGQLAAQSQEVEMNKKKIVILEQKKIKIEGAINSLGGDTAIIERSIKNMQNEMLQLNMLIHREKGISVELQQANTLHENEFMSGLKDAEMESYELEDKLEQTNLLKERLINELMEAERHLMLWNKKMQLAKETKAAVDSEVEQGDIKAMKQEIHRMKGFISKLTRQQEQLLKELERTVDRREDIVLRGEIEDQRTGFKKVLTKGRFETQVRELKKKIKETQKEANKSDGELHMMRSAQEELSAKLGDQQVTVQQMQSEADILVEDIDRFSQTKRKNLCDLVSQQQRGKYYQQLKDGRYTRMCRTDSALGLALTKNEDVMHNIMAITDRLMQEFPHAQPAFAQVNHTYGARAQQQ